MSLTSDCSFYFLQLMRMALPEAGPEIRMVESLQSMWDEEKQRIGCSPPPPPPEPKRTPAPLCLHVEAVRAQFQVSVLPVVTSHPLCLPYCTVIHCKCGYVAAINCNCSSICTLCLSVQQRLLCGVLCAWLLLLTIRQVWFVISYCRLF